MSAILQELASANLVAAFEDNLFYSLSLFGRLGRTTVDDPVGVKRTITDIPFALFNSVMDARLAPEQVDPAIERILADATQRHVPVCWWITPSTGPADLEKHLEGHGFEFDEDAPGMAADLTNLNESLSAPAELAIRLADDAASWRLWGLTMALGFGAPAARAADLADAWREFLRHADPTTTLAYIGWWNDKPVATSLLILGGGVAGIYAVATLPEARRKGIGARLTLYPLQHARARGYCAGVLGASEMGVGVYRSLGFREICRKRTFTWRPAS